MREKIVEAFVVQKVTGKERERARERERKSERIGVAFVVQEVAGMLLGRAEGHVVVHS